MIWDKIVIRILGRPAYARLEKFTFAFAPPGQHCVNASPDYRLMSAADSAKSQTLINIESSSHVALQIGMPLMARSSREMMSKLDTSFVPLTVTVIV